jgi:hypothetical protein
MDLRICFEQRITSIRRNLSQALRFCWMKEGQSGFVQISSEADDAAMACDHLDDDVLEVYFFGHLPERQASTIEEHLISCQTCIARAEMVEGSIKVIKQALTCVEAAATYNAASLHPRVDGQAALAPGGWMPWAAAYTVATVVLAVIGMSTIYTSVQNTRVRTAQRDNNSFSIPHDSVKPSVTSPNGLEVHPRPVTRMPRNRARRPRSISNNAQAIQTARTFQLPARKESRTPAPTLVTCPQLITRHTKPPILLTVSAQPVLPKWRGSPMRRMFTVIGRPFKKIGGALSSIAMVSFSD